VADVWGRPGISFVEGKYPEKSTVEGGRALFAEKRRSELGHGDGKTKTGPLSQD